MLHVLLTTSHWLDGSLGQKVMLYLDQLTCSTVYSSVIQFSYTVQLYSYAVMTELYCITVYSCTVWLYTLYDCTLYTRTVLYNWYCITVLYTAMTSISINMFMNTAVATCWSLVYMSLMSLCSMYTVFSSVYSTVYTVQFIQFSELYHCTVYWTACWHWASGGYIVHAVPVPSS